MFYNIFSPLFKQKTPFFITLFTIFASSYFETFTPYNV